MPGPVQVFAPGQSGYQIPNKPQDWYNYPITFTSVAQTTPQTTNIAIDAGSDFFLTAITYDAYLAASTTALTTSTVIIPGITMLLTDSGSNRQLMQNPVPLSQIGGNGPWPHRMIHPRLFVRNSNIQVAVVRYDAATGDWDTLRINFEGFRIYS